MSIPRLLSVLGCTLVLSACYMPATRVPPPRPMPPPGPSVSTLPVPAPGAEQPLPETPQSAPDFVGPPVPIPAPAPSTLEPLPSPVLREAQIGAAARALVGQAQQQVQARNFDGAAATIERALRIERDNPVLWLEMGRIRLAQGNFSQAEAMGQRALSNAGPYPGTQAAAWRLIAESYRGMGRAMDAREADIRADSLR
jgi:tetratricopeptide (TPR) repeat protein